MNEVVLLFLAIVISSAFISFLSGRRFGALALSLSAGSVLSGLWAEQLADWLADSGWQVAWLPADVLSTVAILLVPVIFLLISGPKYQTKRDRIIASLMFGLLTASFLVQPLGGLMNLEGDALVAYNWLAEIWQYVVSVGLAIGVIDIFLTHSKKPSKSDKKS